MMNNFLTIDRQASDFQQVSFQAFAAEMTENLDPEQGSPLNSNPPQP